MSDLFENAVKKRSGLLSAQTNAVRLMDGFGDVAPGLCLETFAGRWLISTPGDHLASGVREWVASKGVTCYWKRLDQHQKDSPQHLAGEECLEPFLILENGMSLEVSFQSGYSQGIFLDQRDNRLEVRERLRAGERLLNTFAYTGAFSVAGALAGAETTTLDLSQPYLDWTKRNFRHNRLDPEGHHFCKGDTFHWLRRFAKQGRKFDGIVLDPPTFSRDEKGKVFRVERDFGELAGLAAGLLTADGWLLCSTNCRALGMVEFKRQLRAGVGRPMRLRDVPMPEDFSGEAYLKVVWIE